MRTFLALVAVSTATLLVGHMKAMTSPITPVLREVGVKVVTEDIGCVTDRIYGAYQKSTRTLTLCLINHYDAAELQDTVRHEAVHAVQHCVGGPVYSDEWIQRHTTARLESDLRKHYKVHQHKLEREAIVVAQHASDEDVIHLLRKFCRDH